MTDQQQHPITPPPELVQRLYGLPQMRAIETAFQAGADQELEACCEWLGTQLLDGYDLEPIADDLRAARRPKPPSLKAQALEDLEEIDCCAVFQLSGYMTHGDLKRRVSNIRRALEALPND